MRRYIEMAVLAVTLSVPALAQQNGQLPSRSLTIEGNYNPTITEAGKIMPVPPRPQASERQVSVSYLKNANPYPGLSRQPMSVLSEGSDDIRYRRFSGMVRLNYGLRNLHDGLLDAQWRISEKDMLNISGVLDGWNSKPDDKWRSKMGNAGLDATYTHQFKGFSTGVFGGVGHQHFNYRPGQLMDDTKLANSKLMQNVWMGQAGAFVKSDDGDYTSWHLGITDQWYSRKGLKVNGKNYNNRENLIRVSGGFSAPVSMGTVGLEYRQKTAFNNWEGLNGLWYGNNTIFSISPYWAVEMDRFNMSVGLNADLSTGSDDFFPISPNIGASYVFNDKLTFVAGLTGGLEDYDRRHLAAISPYWSEEFLVHDGHTLLDASLGFNYRPGRLGTVSFTAGFRNTEDELFQVATDSLLVTSVLKQQDAQVLYVKLNADMQFSEKALLRMDLTFSDYLGAYYGYKMQLKPALDLKLYGSVNIMKGLDASLSYRLMLFNKVVGKAMPAVNDVALTASYELMKNLSLNLSAQHLAGGNFYYYAGYRCLKPAVLLGVTYRF